MTVPAWQQKIASMSAMLLESIGGPQIGGGLKKGTDLPPFPAQDLEWIPSSLSSPSLTSSNTDTFIEFWSCQCPPCIETIPKMKRIYAGYQDRVRFRTIHVNLHGATSSEIRDFIEENGIEYPVGIDRSDNIWQVFDFSHLPHGLLVDENGTVRWSGSLFTHNLEKVFSDFYGDPKVSDSGTTAELEAPIKKSGPPVGMACSGGVCQMPKKPLKEENRSAPPSGIECSGGVCQLPKRTIAKT